MRKYGSYKDTGIEWIGEIPIHWESTKLKFRGESLIGIIYSPDNVVNIGEGILVLRSSNIQDGKLTFEDCVYVNKKVQLKHLTKEGDILLCARNGSAHLVGKAAFIEKENEGVTFGAFMSIVRSDLEKYLFYFFNSQIFKAQTGLFSTSTINQLTSDTLNNMFISFPRDEKEQTAIANYLDRKTAQIDELIADKKRLLKLYEEEKTAIINELVTGKKVWNGHAWTEPSEVKDSGIEWLGDASTGSAGTIPKNWEVIKLKMLVSKIGSGVTPLGGSSVYLTSGIPLLRSQNIHFEKLKLDDVAYISEEIDEEMKNSRIQENDVLINITGASIGRCFYVPIGFGRGNVNQHVCIIRPFSDKIDTVFLYFQLRSAIGQTQISLQQTGANREGLNFEQLKNFVLTVPRSIDEQQTIVGHIKTECTSINNQIDRTKKLIDLLAEYRTALISEVVTGKVKVVD